LNKGNSFNSKDSKDTSNGFLGTGYWTQSYDCSAYVGDAIRINAFVLINAGTDNRIRAFNILQKFDSKALEIDPSRDIVYNPQAAVSDKVGTAKFLYAADPLYPKGYDSNDTEQMKRMNAAKEEDYIYFETLEALESKGYTCIAILTEGRNVDVMGGKYLYVSIPVKVKENSELIGKTICTVNTTRVWKNEGDMAGISWLNGNYDAGTQKNTVAGWIQPEYKSEHDATGYIKTEYENGILVNGTHKNGPAAGNSLLILGYHAEIQMNVKNTYTGEEESSTNPSINFDVGKGQRTATYKLNASTKTGSETKSEGKTNLIITVNVEEKMKITPKGYTMQGTEISDDPDSPTTFLLSTGDTISLYANRDAIGKNLEIHLKEVPIGIELPEIMFTVELGIAGSDEDVQNGQRLNVKASIVGEGDNRAILADNHNISTSNIGIISLASAALAIATDKELVEANEMFTYTLKYANTGQSIVKKTYMYSLLPYNGDMQNSKVDGVLDVEKIEATLTGGEETGFNVIADIYYSTIEAGSLEPIIRTFGEEEEETGTSIDQMLEKGYIGKDGTQFIDVDGTLAGNADFRKLFKKWGRLEAGHTQLQKEAIPDEKEAITCVYIVAQNIKIGKALNLHISIQPDNNEAANVYGNIFYNWIVENPKSSALRSNAIYTTVFARSISGLVWEDSNRNGVKDEEEEGVRGVEVGVFRYNEQTSQYEVYAENMAGEPMNAISTNEAGEYVLSKLSPGKYVVVFKGDVLQHFTHTKYQVNGKNDENTSDGVKIEELHLPEITGYVYAIKQLDTESFITLHTIDEITNENIVVENYQEKYKNQDLGVCPVQTLEFTKVKAEDTTKGIGGTKFSLYKCICNNTTHTEEYHNASIVEEGSSNSCWELVANTVSSEEGYVKFEGLICEQEYRLVETKASLNRLTPEGQWKVCIGTDGNASITAVGTKLPLAFIEKPDGSMLLPNMAMFSIPTAGNIGTGIFKVLGMACILVGSYSMHITKKRPKRRGKHEIRR